MTSPASRLGFLKAASDGIADLVEQTGHRVTAVHARRRFSTPHGLLIAAVERGGPGAAAGLSVGDIVIGFDGRPCARTEDALAALGATMAGGTLGLRVIRAGQPIEVTLTLGERPQRRRCA